MDRAIPHVHQIKSPTHCEVLIVLIALEDIYIIPLYGKAIVNVSELFLILGTSIIRVYVKSNVSYNSIAPHVSLYGGGFGNSYF